MTVIYTFRALLPLAAAAAAVCRCTAVAVCHRVPGGKICCWFIESDCIQCFFLIKHVFFLTYAPLGSTVAFAELIGLYYILGKFGHARSQGGGQPVGDARSRLFPRLQPGDPKLLTLVLGI